MKMLVTVVMMAACATEMDDIGETEQALGPPFASHFENKSAAGWDLCYTGETCQLGDVNSDGHADLVQFTNTTFLPNVRVALYDPTYGVFVNQPAQLYGFCPRGSKCLVGDLNADGQADVVSIPPNGQQVSAAFSNGAGGFGTPRPYGYACYSGQDCILANVDPFAGADMVGFDRATRKTWVYTNDGGLNGFATQNVWSHWFCGPGEKCTATDLTGDGRADLVSFVNGQAWIGVASGEWVTTPFYSYYSGKFEQAALWTDGICLDSAEDCQAADVTGDGMGDLVMFKHQAADSSVWVARGKTTFGRGFEAPALWHSELCGPTETCLLGQIDGAIANDVVTLTRDPTNYAFKSFGL